MDFISIREFRTQPGKVWEKLAEAQAQLRSVEAALEKLG